MNNFNRTLIGVVLGNKMSKTISISIERRNSHKKYDKYVLRTTKIFAHDEDNVCQVGDKVMVKEVRPLSKNKNWILVKILKK